MLDRLDLQIEVPALTAAELFDAQPGEPSTVVRERVVAARKRQRARGLLNAAIPAARLKALCPLDLTGQRLVTDAVDRGGMSARGVHRALRVARTIADLEGKERLTALGVAEALQYRAYESRALRPT